MPHAIIEGSLTPAIVHRDLEPIQVKEGARVMKLGEPFLGRSGRVVLIEATVVEGPPRVVRRFFVEIDGREESLTVRLYQLTDPEKTEGVRRIVALTAQRVRALAADGRILRSNLDAFLEDYA